MSKTDFEAWYTRNIGGSLLRAMGRKDTAGRDRATYHYSGTETAWRVWALANARTELAESTLRAAGYTYVVSDVALEPDEWVAPARPPVPVMVSLSAPVPSNPCDVPPAGYVCTRIKGHPGPCAAYPAPLPTHSVIRHNPPRVRQLKGAPVLRPPMSEACQAAFEATAWRDMSADSEIDASMWFGAGWAARGSRPAGQEDEDDPYNHACEIMEDGFRERAKRRVEIGTEGSLCDGIGWLFERIKKLETATAPVSQPAGQEPVGIVRANHPVHGWHMEALIAWDQIGGGTYLYTAPQPLPSPAGNGP